MFKNLKHLGNVLKQKEVSSCNIVLSHGKRES